MAPEPQLSYCINSVVCEKPENHGHDIRFCKSCGAKLLVNDRYRLIQILEKDNADVNKRVFLGHDTHNNNEPCILKIIDLPKKGDLNKYLEREFEFLRTVGGPFPNLLNDSLFEWVPHPEYDFFKTYVLVLPWIEGKDSFDWIKENGPISESQCVDWLLQILDYLEILSDISTMHRDIKPENMIVTPDKRIKLIDFGSVRSIDQDYISILEGKAVNDDGTPRRATRIFTFGYSPPEQLVGRASLQSDFYALGKSAIYWLTGKAPADLIEDDMDNWDEACPNVSKTFIRYIDCLTNKHPAQRPINAYAIRFYLQNQYVIDLDREQYQKKINRIANAKLYSVLAVFLFFGLTWFGVSQTLFAKGSEAFQGEQYDRAIKNFNLVLKINPIHGGALYYLGLNCQRVGDTQCALEKYNQSLRWSRNPSAALYQLGIIEDEQGNYAAAKKYYSASLEKEPENPEALARLSRLSIIEDKFEVAQSYIDEALSYANDDDIKARLLFQQGWLYFKLKKWQKSEEALNMSSELKDNADSFCLLAKNAINQNIDQRIINTYWYDCFYEPAFYPEGDELKSELLRKAIPEIFVNE